MTRIVLFLTAIPLAAVLALVFNTLLEGRLAATEKLARRASESTFRHGLSIAFVLTLSLAVAPALAESAEPACTSIDCSLIVDAVRVDQLWKNESDGGGVLIAQSPIPVVVDADLERRDASSSGVISEDERLRSRPVATERTPTTRP